MSSNEHPDMSGNPCDAPYLCDWCEKEMDIEKAYGSDLDKSEMLNFCSADCQVDWEEDFRTPVEGA